jgi:hypothetical protein
MTLNPELRRNLWLELTPQRLIAMPVVLGLIFALAYTVSTDQPGNVAEFARYTFLILVILWGTRRAAASMGGEVRDGTWDWQRMSALGPWAMGWGKLLGSTSFAWYGGAICLVTYVIFMPPFTSPAAVLSSLALMIGSGLLGQAVALGTALAWLRKIRPERRVPVTMCQALGIVAGYGNWYLSVTGSESEWISRQFEIDWYGWQIVGTEFVTLSVFLFLGWALVGVWRMMQAELQVRTRPWAWPAFTLSTIVYGLGLYLGQCVGCTEFALHWLAAPYAIAVAALYAALFLDRKDVVRSRSLLAAIAARDWGRAAGLAPFWLPAVLLFAIVAFAVIGGAAFDAPVGAVFAADLFDWDAWVVVTNVVAHMAFVLRDLCLVLALNFGENRRRADFAALIYLAVLYGLVPGILLSIDLGWQAAMFLPLVGDWAWIGLISAAVQAAAAFAFLAYRWRRVRRRLEPGAGAPAVRSMAPA